MATLFGTDRVLLYDVAPWNTLGFGVPAFGDNGVTINVPIAGLVDEVGQVQLYVMTHVDAMRKQPPSPNTIIRLGKITNRVQTILGSRQKDFSTLRVEPGHATGAPEQFRIHPVPFFDGPIVRNRWLKEYNRLTMMALTNMMQHSDNNLSLTITQQFAQDVWVYFKEIQLLLGSELLGLAMTELRKEDFRFTEAHFAGYNPADVTVNMESLDRPGPLLQLPTEGDLKPLFDGIPANLIRPNLKQYPVGPGADGLSGVQPAAGTGAVAASGADAATSPVIGPPTP